MGRFVMDASAVIAVLREEPGAEQVIPHLFGSLISTVNLAEVFCKSQSRGILPATDALTIQQMKLEVVPFDAEQAQLLANILPKTLGSSVGFADRACMALAMQQQMPALTGDRDWLKHDAGVEIQLFRNREAA